MIVLKFQSLKGESEVLVRGTHFRICSDGTLRGPDNTAAARYLDGRWHLGQRRYPSFECTGPIYLRITNNGGQRKCIGPYASIRATNGAIFAPEACLGAHSGCTKFGAERLEVWQEVSFVTSI